MTKEDSRTKTLSDNTHLINRLQPFVDQHNTPWQTDHFFPFTSVHSLQQPHWEFSGRVAGQIQPTINELNAHNDKYFNRIYFLKQETKSRNEKETSNQRMRKCKVKCYSSVPVESQYCQNKPEAGTLEGFHLKENVKYSVKNSDSHYISFLSYKVILA